ncbi:ATP-dependent helicase HrpA [Oleiphilus messinensis]|uniref:ATP-dependent helicase HrpA n=1 Tax=Oleiphilus messinensis TaxID=141451 RepID=A0A1Y0IB26_9GAMM|nr:ATP-dependent RNA helicase HrpA [Oleiphilus messinensis]ARU57369.1 ATP-dependent helicase HrpA [Oleiphilus messinensis]
MDSQVTPDSLFEQTLECTGYDQWRLRRRIRNLRKVGDHKKRDKIVQQIATDLDAAKARLSARKQALPSFQFPPELPVSEKHQEIAEAINANQVVILAGETGSGKTTQLPKICLSVGLGIKGLIGHTQPRRLAARSVASRIAEECNVKLGEQVGFQVRFTDQVSENTLVKLMTDGILLAEIQHDPMLRRYETIIIDEAHERSLNIDFLLGYLKQLLPKRPDLKVIVTSATIDVERFSRFFENAPIIEVSGRTYPVELVYRPLTELQNDSEDEVDLNYAIQQVVEEIIAVEREHKQSMGDVLVFLPGEREIRDAAKHLRHCEFSHTEILPLYARLTSAEQNKIFAPHRGRRIVLSTNVAETSLTVPGIRYVIDPGIARISRYSFRSKVQRLPIEAISQASANQRKGRCGRVAEGVCFRLYSEEDFLSRSEFTDPEIVRTNLASVILQMANLRLGDVHKFPFVEKPDSRLINDGYKLLQELGAVNTRNELTDVGKKLSMLPIDPRLAKMIVHASELGAVKEVMIIASALSVQDPREVPQERQQAAQQCHREYADKASDFLSFVNLWNLYEEKRQALSGNQLQKYCKKHFLSYLRMREWRDIHRQIYLVVKQMGISLNETAAGFEQVHRALLAGLLGNVGEKDENFIFKGTRNKKFQIFPGSMLFKKPPKWIVAAELVETSKVYARTVAAIDPEWIEPLARHVVKHHYFEPHWEKRRGQVIGYEEIRLYGLQIVAKRRVNYAKIDPVLSRELFIRHGLVEGELDSKAPFLRKNRELIAEIEGLEDKARRKDILVDDEVLFAFYDRSIPDSIVSRQHFDAWWKKASREDLAPLYLTEADLMQHSADAVSEFSFPDEMNQGALRFNLEYAFKPGQESDGVTLTTPLATLKQLNTKDADWLVPGLLRDKCIQLVKGLPKQYRKHFVPVPDVVDKALQAMSPGAETLHHQLAKQLYFHSGIRLPEDVWRDVVIDDHLRMNFRLVDDQGKTITESRDLQKLFDDYGDEATQRQAIQKVTTGWDGEGLTEWNFGPLKASLTRKHSGVAILMYPYIEDNRSSVSLSASTDQYVALEKTQRGIARLILLAEQPLFEFITESLVSFDKSALLFAPVGRKQALLDDFLLGLVMHHYLSDGIPRNRDEFFSLLKRKKADLHDAALKYDELILSVMLPYHENMKRLKGKVNLVLANNMADAKFQLSHLVFPGFIQQTPFEWLTELPRYLSAVMVRLEKMPREMAKERYFLTVVKPMWDQYETLREQNEKQGKNNPELTQYRWMLEEFRVSYFAQQLGTRMTISEKRLMRQWDSVKQAN